MIKLPIINNSHYDLPSYSTKQSSGLDLRANILEKIRHYLSNQIPGIKEERQKQKTKKN